MNLELGCLELLWSLGFGRASLLGIFSRQNHSRQHANAKYQPERGIRMFSKQLVGSANAGEGLCLQPPAACLEVLEPGLDFLILFQRQFCSRSLGKLIRALHDQHQIIDQLLQRSPFRNQIFIIKFHSIFFVAPASPAPLHRISF